MVLGEVVEVAVVEETLLLEAPEAIARLRVPGGQVVIISTPTDQDPTRVLGHHLRAVIAVAPSHMHLDPEAPQDVEVDEKTATMITLVIVSDAVAPVMIVLAVVAALVLQKSLTDE